MAGEITAWRAATTLESHARVAAAAVPAPGPRARRRTAASWGDDRWPAERGQVQRHGHCPALAAGPRLLIGGEPGAGRGVARNGGGVVIMLPLIAPQLAVAPVAVPRGALPPGVLR